jgi:uncharacterized protein YkwD
MNDLARPDVPTPHRTRRRARRLAPLVGLLIVIQLVAACLPATQQEQDVWLQIIGARKAAGITSPLYANDDLTARAQGWARTLATRGETGTTMHSDLHTLNTGWLAVAENVGRGSSLQQVHDAFMASAAHRANILDPQWNQLGVGVATSRNGTLFVVQVFQRV